MRTAHRKNKNKSRQLVIPLSVNSSPLFCIGCNIIIVVIVTLMFCILFCLLFLCINALTLSLLSSFLLLLFIDINIVVIIIVAPFFFFLLIGFPLPRRACDRQAFYLC